MSQTLDQVWDTREQRRWHAQHVPTTDFDTWRGNLLQRLNKEARDLPNEIVTWWAKCHSYRYCRFRREKITGTRCHNHDCGRSWVQGDAGQKWMRASLKRRGYPVSVQTEAPDMSGITLSE